MSAPIIPNNTPFGGMTNQTIGRLIALNSTLPRLQQAIAAASNGFEGTPGTEYEGEDSNFGVVPSDTPGAPTARDAALEAA